MNSEPIPLVNGGLSVRPSDWLSASLIVDLSAEKTSVKCYQLIYINFNDKA